MRLLARSKGHTFTSVGELTLKGLPEPVPASEVGWTPLAAGVPVPPRLATPPALAMFGRDEESAAIAAAWAKSLIGRQATRTQYPQAQRDILSGAKFCVECASPIERRHGGTRGRKNLISSISLGSSRPFRIFSQTPR